MTGELEFSVILPVCHSGRFLRAALASLRLSALAPGRFEVLVAGTEEDLESCRIVETASAGAEFDLTYVGCVSASRSALLNAACAVARGRFLAFADDDCTFPPEWLSSLLEALQSSPDAGVVGGPDEFCDTREAFGLALDRVLNSFMGTGGCRRGAGAKVGKYYPKLWNMAVPRDVALSVSVRTEGGASEVFNESLAVHEDVELAERIERAGKRIVFAPRARLTHCRDTTFGSFVHRNFDIARTCRALGVHRLPHMVLAAVLIGVSAVAVLSPFSGAARIVLCVCAATYAASVLGTALSAVRRTRDLRMLVLVPLLLGGLHVARGLGYLLPWPDGSRTEVYS